VNEQSEGSPTDVTGFTPVTGLEVTPNGLTWQQIHSFPQPKWLLNLPFCRLRHYNRVMTATKVRQYYSVRTGKNPDAAKLDLNALKTLFHSAYSMLAGKGYFDEAFGYWCVDADDVPGTVGCNVGTYVAFKLRRANLWPINENIGSYAEVNLFDMIEFLHDHVSKPTDGHYHSWNDCGMHWTKFDRSAGQAELRETLNPLLECYGPGFALSEQGEIMGIAPAGLTHLLDGTPPRTDRTALSRIAGAVARFRRGGSSIEDRRQAVRDLADVLELLRPQIKTALLKNDERDLFNLANNFGIRHLNEAQKRDYDPAVWLSWMFYYYLATIYACLHLIERQERGLIPPKRPANSNGS